MVDVKFCGLTREADAECAVRVGAAYGGVIFAGGPRAVDAARAERVLRAAGSALQRVGVFGPDFRTALPDVLAMVDLDVVQLHGDPDANDVREARRLFRGMVWAAVRVRDAALPTTAAELAAEADALLLDAKVDGTLGGSGVALPWARLAEQVVRVRRGLVVLAGGLTPENVEDAIAALEPDIVDVSSGVEHAPGVKDHERMLAFAAAARRALR